MLETNLCQNNVCGPFTKHRNRIFKSYRDVHDAACYNSNDLANRTISDKIFEDRVYEIAINCNYGGV